MMKTVDGEYQDYKSKDGAYVRKYFFGKTPETLKLVEDMTDDQVWRLTRGGHDLDKIYAAYHEAATNPEGKPVVILAKTIKGYGLQGDGESQNIAHNVKHLSVEALKGLRDKFSIPIEDDRIAEMPYLMPQVGSEEYEYLHAKRDALGGSYPERRVVNCTYNIPTLDVFQPLLESGGTKENSTTMAFVRILNILLKDKSVGQYIVPIVPDESRTFGMEGMFRQYGIWNHLGQLYTPEDASQLMYYKESVKGQILQEGINEPGAMCTWIAAATSHANNGIPMIPFYIYYSMFGFQRIGDLAWAAGDQRARGFLIGGTAGRTTLNGEGLQHEDGHSLVQAGLIPNCEAYDPTFAYELAVIIQHGLQEMYVENQDKYYYVTVMNENYTQPAMPKNAEKGIIAGAYLFDTVMTTVKKAPVVNLMGSGTIFRESIAAAHILSEKYGVKVNLIAALGLNKLHREAMSLSRSNRYNLEKKETHLTKLLNSLDGVLTVATTDYIRIYAEQVREQVPHKYVVLGTDGFGRSDYRRTLREYFEVNAKHIVYTTLFALYEQGLVAETVVKKAIKDLEIDTKRANPWTE